MRRLFWPVLATLLLEGFFLGVQLVWMGTAAAIAFFVYLAYEAVRAHRNIVKAIDLVSRDSVLFT